MSGHPDNGSPRQEPENTGQDSQCNQNQYQVQEFTVGTFLLKMVKDDFCNVRQEQHQEIGDNDAYATGNKIKTILPDMSYDCTEYFSCVGSVLFIHGLASILIHSVYNH
jgi:hypothetical protein